MVRFGFIGLHHPLGARTLSVANTNRSFSQYEEWKSEMNASEKRGGCKVARMLMELSGYCFFE
jgi:hypothetical protein